MTKFTWDEDKAAKNLVKHGVTFAEATLVFFDEHAILKQDRIKNGEYRWQAIGKVNNSLVLMVAHTWQDEDDGEIVRIISARKATKLEIKAYGKNRYL
ncbi:BrnT family toxin [Moraxella catarrhalis]|uniref:BrnT family toxin n=1 Tax=Moraxella catarrhalis TaxID=480 RepID=UPI0012CCD3E2|nr:BrnT family toxin [Moraxella catarrhalis]MPW47516.1 BrnT family toxin [Moraxella catarrhalis]MPW49319.1 BrnT family toxin [Moraxella catarrhalis]